MSNIDLEKDELATQEMLAMLGETDDAESLETHIDSDIDTNFDMDDLLNSIAETEISPEPEAIENILEDDAQSDLDDLDVQIDEANQDMELADFDDLDLDLEINPESAALDEMASLEEELEEIPSASAMEPTDLSDLDLAIDSDIENNELEEAFDMAEPSQIDDEAFDSELDEGLHDDMLQDQVETSNDMASVEALELEETLEDALEAIDSDATLENETLSDELDINPIADEMPEDDLEIADTLATDELVAEEPILEPVVEQGAEAVIEDVTEDAFIDNLEEDDPLTQANSLEESVEQLAQQTAPMTDASELTSYASEKITEDSHSLAEDTEHNNHLLEQALTQMVEAIQMNETIQQFAKQVEATTLKATKLALATAAKAQSEALKTQELLEANFAAAQNAFEKAEESGYQISANELEPLAEASDSEMDAFLAEIAEKNRSLNETNQKLAQRLASIQQS